MISSVTISTVSTITSAASIAAFGLVVILTLIAFVVVKELASSGNDARLQTLSRVLNIAIVPLLIVFVAIVANKVVEVL